VSKKSPTVKFLVFDAMSPIVSALAEYTASPLSRSTAW